MPSSAEDRTTQQRVVFVDNGWYYRVRGGSVVGPFADQAAANDAVAAYRASCMSRLSLNAFFRPWRKPRALPAQATEHTGAQIAAQTTAQSAAQANSPMTSLRPTGS